MWGSQPSWERAGEAPVPGRGGWSGLSSSPRSRGVCGGTTPGRGSVLCVLRWFGSGRASLLCDNPRNVSGQGPRALGPSPSRRRLLQPVLEVSESGDRGWRNASWAMRVSGRPRPDVGACTPPPARPRPRMAVREPGPRWDGLTGIPPGPAGPSGAGGCSGGSHSHAGHAGHAVPSPGLRAPPPPPLPPWLGATPFLAKVQTLSVSVSHTLV